MPLEKELLYRIRNNDPTLISLDFSCQGSNSVNDPETAKALSIALKENHTVTSLNLSSSKFKSNFIGAEGAKALSEVLKENHTLTLLNLEGNEIGSDGAQALSAALKWNEMLTFLYLDGNGIGDQGAKAFSTALKENRTLMLLDLGLNGITTDGVNALNMALKENRTLISLGLKNLTLPNYQSTTPSDEIAKALSITLKENRTLTSLDIRYNKIGANGANALIEMLENNYTLTFLNFETHSCLAANYFGSQATKEKFKALLERNQCLRSEFILAAQQGNLVKVKDLFKKGVSIHATREKGMTVLHLAVQQGQLEVVQFLIEQGANRNIRNEEGQTPLDLAKQYQHTKIIYFLSGEKASVSQPHSVNVNVLQKAQQSKEQQNQKNTDINHTNPINISPINTGTAVSCYSEITPSIPLTRQNWVVSILRHDGSENPDHAILIVEGINQTNQAELWKFHFLKNRNHSGQGLVLTDEYIVTIIEKKSICNKILKDRAYYAQSWGIEHDQAMQLHKDVMQDKKQPPPYATAGDRSGCTSQQGHNCFTWARKKLHNLNDTRINLPLLVTDFIAAKTSFYLPAPGYQGSIFRFFSGWSIDRKFAMNASLIVGAAVIVSYGMSSRK